MKKRLKNVPCLRKAIIYIKSLFPNQFIYTAKFYKWYNFLQESQWWSEHKLEEYQWHQLIQLLKHCYENVPYYHNMFRELNATPQDVRCFDDFHKLPFLTKDIVRNRLSEFIPRGAHTKHLSYVTTGGTTGTPLGFYKEKHYDSINRAFTFSLYRRFSFKPGDLLLRLRGEIIPNGRLWNYDPLANAWLFSSYLLSRETISDFVRKINSIRPPFLHVYPSSMWIFTKLVTEAGLQLTFTPRAILCESETLYPFQRKLFERTFKCTVANFLGQSEGVIRAGECEKRKILHIFPEYSYVELIDKNGHVISETGRTGEIVGTSFMNYVTPFIRYKTGDIAVHSNQRCSCGRNYPLLEGIEGRVQEFILAKDGSLVPHISWAHDMEWAGIEQVQFLQERQGKLTIKVVKKAPYDESDIKKYILDLYMPRFEGLCELDVIFVTHITRTKGGKYRFLIQKLPIEFQNRRKSQLRH